MRSRLERRGLLNGALRRARLRLPALWLMLLAVVGVVRVIAGVRNDRPVLWLILAVIVTVVAAVVVASTVPRLSPAGRRVLEDAGREYAHLDPANQPAWSTYGASGLALAVAVYGFATMTGYDPQFAVEAELHRAVQSGGHRWRRRRRRLRRRWWGRRLWRVRRLIRPAVLRAATSPLNASPLKKVSTGTVQMTKDRCRSTRSGGDRSWSAQHREQPVEGAWKSSSARRTPGASPALCSSPSISPSPSPPVDASCSFAAKSPRAVPPTVSRPLMNWRIWRADGCGWSWPRWAGCVMRRPSTSPPAASWRPCARVRRAPRSTRSTRSSTPRSTGCRGRTCAGSSTGPRCGRRWRRFGTVWSRRGCCPTAPSASGSGWPRSPCCSCW